MNDNDIAISVIVPMYKAERYIKRLADSLFTQTIQAPVEYLFIDDGSPDNTAGTLRAVGEKYPQHWPHARIIRHDKNRGLSAARLTGLENATGKYVIHFDSDDWVESDMLKKMYDAAEENHADMVCCGIIEEQPGQKVLLNYTDNAKRAINTLNNYSFSVLYSSFCNKLVRLKYIRENGFLPKEGLSQWEDLFYQTQLRCFTDKIEFLPDALYHYDMTNTSSMTYHMTEEKIMERVAVVRLLEEVFSVRAAVNVDASSVISFLKVEAKGQFLLDVNLWDPKKWRHTFPELNIKAIQFTNAVLATKLGFLLVACHLDALAWVLFRIRKALKSGRV